MAMDIIDVLLVDDDPDICMMMESILKFAGYSVQYCSVAERIPQVLATVSPRLILMDMFLSGTDGRDVCRNIKSQPAYDAIKIMMMSAHPDAQQTCMDAGADEFLPKPFDIDNFIGKVRRVLNG
jgi:DNA-binding response OmpR family regulator